MYLVTSVLSYCIAENTGRKTLVNLVIRLLGKKTYVNTNKMQILNISYSCLIEKTLVIGQLLSLYYIIIKEFTYTVLADIGCIQTVVE